MSKKEVDKVGDSVVIASIANSEFSDAWRKMSRERRREILEILAGRSDTDSIRAAFYELTTGQKPLF